MFRIITLVLAFVVACTVPALAQSAGSSSSSAAKDAKEVQREKIMEAQEMCNLYLYLFTRATGTDRHYRNYLWWLNRRGELVREQSGK